ncbi:MAG TPA: lipid-binding SYLF domain-containing protein [Pirellulaceae bacterium]|jgi:lipid-binding SYLF domain-containing protein
MTSARFQSLLVVVFVPLVSNSAFAFAGASEDRTIQGAHEVIQQFQQLQIREIPESLLANAQAVAIIPNVIKLGFVVGGQRGHGVVVIRQPDGAWRAPVFITITGGSIGWQVGAQATDFVLVFKTQRSVDGLMRGKFTLGADAAIAAGPVGRRAEAATDVELKAEIYSYSRSRGLFAGVSLEGSALQIDDQANANYYGGPAMAGAPAAIPPGAQSLVQIIAALTGPSTGPIPMPAGAMPTPAVAPAGAMTSISSSDSAATQAELARAAANLNAVLDDSWRRYLAMPAEIYDPNRRPAPQTIEATLARFNTVASNPQYQALASRPEFRAMQQLLQRLDASLRISNPGPIALPPPPAIR